LSESSWLGTLENGFISSMAGPWNSSGNGELDIVLSVEMGVWSSDVIFLIKNSSPDD